MKKIFAAFVFLALTVGCHAQVPQTTWEVNVTWTAPSVCSTASPCIFVVSRAAPVAGTCPVNTGTTYAQVGSSASQASSLTDTTVSPGQSYCYVAQTQQAGGTGLPSAPSNVVPVPTNPPAPGTPAATAQVKL